MSALTFVTLRHHAFTDFKARCTFTVVSLEHGGCLVLAVRELLNLGARIRLYHDRVDCHSSCFLLLPTGKGDT